MKVKGNIGFFRFACIAVLCAGVAFFVSTCKDDDDDCKTCTKNAGTEEEESRTYCGDELKEAELLPGVTCK